jgi:putative endopeptidase
MNKNYILNTYEQGKPNCKDDFYGCVNYEWIRNNRIPDDEIKYTHFISTQLNINNQLKIILENNEFPLATQLYNSYNNMEYRNSHCLDQMKELLNITNGITNKSDLMVICAKLAYIGVGTLFNISIDSNIYNSNQNMFYIAQPSLGLPDKEYYHNPKHNSIKQKYYETICLIYRELNPTMSTTQLNQMAEFIIDFESKMSIIFLSSADRRDADSTYHFVDYNELDSKYPQLHLKKFIQTLCSLSNGVISENNFSTVIMEHHKDNSIDYFNQLQLLLETYTLSQIIEYFKFQTILGYMNLTNDKMREIHFNMFKKTIRGQKKPKSLWRSGLAFTSSVFNDPISRIYNQRYFSVDAETYMIKMVKHIKKATKKRILGLDWMSDVTKERALRKLKKMKLRLGYSKSEPRVYPNIELTRCLIKNTIIMNTFNTTYALNKLNRPVDFEDWELPSYIVNAYFNPTRNEILFPAAILQPPFLDLSKSHIYNYSNIGSVIGHEIIHGFDDQGAKFDENGSVNDWWQQSDKINYEEKVRKIREIYNAEGINGKLTAGENIADFGAVIMPLIGLKYKLNRQLSDDEIKEFYASYASHWQYLIRPEAAEERKLSDPHAFSDLRVNIPLKHSPIFQRVFDIGKKNKMYVAPENILVMW